jgi:hypothetical protein
MSDREPNRIEVLARVALGRLIFSKTFNKPKGFEPGFWRLQSEWFACVPKRSIRLDQVRRLPEIAAKR